MTKRMLWPVLLVVLGLVLAACGGGGGGGGGTPTPKTYTVSGTIEDDSNQPIEGAIVTLSGPSIRNTAVPTDAKGEWRATDLRGEVTVTISHPDYSFGSATETVTKARSDVNFVGTLLPPTPFVVEGTVLDTTGAALQHVEIKFSGGFSAVTTDAQGKWTSPELVRSVTVTPHHPSYVFEPEERSVTLEDAIDPVTFQGIKRTPVSGTVTDGDSDPLPGVTIRIAYGDTEEKVTTDAFGKWSYEDSLGTVTVEAIDPAYNFADSPRIVNESTTGVDFVGTMQACSGGDRDNEKDPCIITRIKQLQKINENPSSLSGHYALGADIDASATQGWNWRGGDGFERIGTSMTPFMGSLDGHGYEIRGLHITTDFSDGGLFGYIGDEGSVRNLRLVGGEVNGSNTVGSVAGQNEGTIEHVYSNLPVRGKMRVGGIVGINHEQGAIRHVHYNGSVYGTGHDTNPEGSTGGIAGRIFGGTIEDATNDGNVEGEKQNVGGIAGQNQLVGKILRSHNHGTIVGLDNHVGGIVGSNSGTVGDSSNSESIHGAGHVGGIAGHNFGGAEIRNSYNEGTVHGDNDHVGGVVGNHNGSLSNSYNLGSVDGATNVGGLVGNFGNGSSIEYSYNAGPVVASQPGGLVGQAGNATVTASFWDTEVTGIEQAGLDPDKYGEGKTTTEMQQEATYVDWDFVGVWSSSEGFDYPDLIDNPR